MCIVQVLHICTITTVYFAIYRRCVYVYSTGAAYMHYNYSLFAIYRRCVYVYSTGAAYMHYNYSLFAIYRRYVYVFSTVAV
jgi:hypothetical protein